MPWHVERTSACPASKPWGVIADTTGKVVGCHATRRAANSQLAALYANVPDVQLSERDELHALGLLRLQAEQLAFAKRRDAPIWLAAWKSRGRWHTRWERTWAVQLRRVQESIHLEGIVADATSKSLLRKTLTPDEVGRRLRAEVSEAAFVEGGMAAYLGLAADMGEDAGQFSLDALGLGRTFSWANPRGMARDLFEVRGSKVVQNLYGSHIDKLRDIIVEATDPRHPLTIGEVTSRVRSEWNDLAGWQAQRIARTETAALWETTTYNTMRANGVERFNLLIASGPSITDVNPVCPICLDAVSNYPRDVGDIVDLPPYHPNCRCTHVPELRNPDGSFWLPPKEPWAGQNLPLCGGVKKTRLTKDELVRKTGAPGACVVAAPLPGASLPQLPALNTSRTGVANFQDVAVRDSFRKPVKDFAASIEDDFPGVSLDLKIVSEGVVISWIEVAEGLRGQGIGTQVMARIVAWADENRLPLVARPISDGARALNARVGFTDMDDGAHQIRLPQ